MKTPSNQRPKNKWKHLYNLNPIPAAVTVHFTGKAAMYARHRPDYAEAAVRSLIANANLRPDSIAADIGSGTGLFSRHLLDAGLRVIGVEPNDEMREEAAIYLAGRCLSSSFAPRKGDPEYAPYIADLRVLFDRYSREGILLVEDVTMYFLGKV